MAETGRLLGVSVVGELTLPCKGGDSPQFSSERMLGLVIADEHSLTIKQLRSLLKEGIEGLPSSYRFVTSQGWPVSARQEPLIKAVHVVNESGLVRLQRTYRLPRVGIVGEDGFALGFLVIEMTETVRELRNSVKRQTELASKLIGDNFHFLDQNGWPIGQNQETDLTVADILIGQTAKLRAPALARESQMGMDWMPGIAHPHMHQREPILHTHHGGGQLALCDANESMGGKGETDEAKQILISYVRKEAAKHARDLKSALCVLGFSVYLDVHEIKPGVDWQDSLNIGVSNCQVFIPLVTPSYGETRWTNREVKLADVLGKYMVPVNFLSDWPPRSLAIQFATTQFIPWKFPGCDSENYIWDEESIKRVAKDIGEKTLNQITSTQSETSSKTEVQRNSSHIEKQLILICCHFAQKAIVEHIQEFLEESGYSVWSATKLSQAESTHVRTSQKPAKSVSFCVGIGKEFMEKVDEAACVVMAFSAAFAKSLVCQQQIYYCEHRKRIVKLQAETFAFPPWLSMLIGTRGMIDVSGQNYETTLKDVLQKTLDADFDPQLEDAEQNAQLVKDVQILKDLLPYEKMVYISGGISFYNPKSESICKAIGQHLAANPDITLVTGGFYGVGETIGKSFVKRREELALPCGTVHVLPVKEKQDFSNKAVQNSDGSFSALPYGKTKFCGTSVRQRERLVSRVLKICILVEGGPGAAHEAEEFAWNDHTVVPVVVTGGAAGGSFGVPSTIFQVPPGVSDSQWSVLSNQNASTDSIGLAVASVVRSLLLEEETSTQEEGPCSPATTITLKSTQEYKDE
eukprot:m.20358 g.20358  ORF g.20358 m.20358 type:complete len:804 (+) comp28004_c0_seq2:101-2512(+)